MSAKKPYHKENLRRDLLDAGREFVRANGHLGLSIRTMAQQVGVSPGAPYHHFPDRRSFLLALAVEGFGEMMAKTPALVSGQLPASEKLREMGVRFVRFAETNPHLIDLMYESELTTPSLDPELLKFQIMGHAALRQIIGEALPGLSDGEYDLRVIAYWSAIYGFASMRKKGVIHTEGITLLSVDIADAIIDRAVLAALAP